MHPNPAFRRTDTDRDLAFAREIASPGTGMEPGIGMELSRLRALMESV